MTKSIECMSQSDTGCTRWVNLKFDQYTADCEDAVCLSLDKCVLLLLPRYDSERDNRREHENRREARRPSPHRVGGNRDSGPPHRNDSAGSGGYRGNNPPNDRPARDSHRGHGECIRCQPKF